MSQIQNLASYIPAKVRQWIYSVLAALIALELVWDLIPAGWESKILGTIVVLGFGMAAANSTDEP